MARFTLVSERVFVTSDTHFGHQTVARLRGFTPADPHDPAAWDAAITEHDEAIIDAWNATVPANGTVVHLGDVTFHRRHPERTAQILNRLNGDVWFVPGNHDKTRTLIALAGPSRVLDPIVTLRFPTAGESRPTSGRCVLSHFPLAAWEAAEYGRPHLHGHLHTGLNGHRVAVDHGHPAVRRDVGVDTSVSQFGLRRFAPIPLHQAIAPA